MIEKKGFFAKAQDFIEQREVENKRKDLLKWRKKLSDKKTELEQMFSKVFGKKMKGDPLANVTKSYIDMLNSLVISADSTLASTSTSEKLMKTYQSGENPIFDEFMESAYSKILDQVSSHTKMVEDLTKMDKDRKLNKHQQRWQDLNYGGRE